MRNLRRMLRLGTVDLQVAEIASMCTYVYVIVRVMKILAYMHSYHRAWRKPPLPEIW